MAGGGIVFPNLPTLRQSTDLGLRYAGDTERQTKRRKHRIEVWLIDNQVCFFENAFIAAIGRIWAYANARAIFMCDDVHVATAPLWTREGLCQLIRRFQKASWKIAPVRHNAFCA